MILDTNGLSDFLDGNPGIVNLLNDVTGIFLPVIVVGEYRFGLRGSRLKKEVEPQFEAFMNFCSILDVTETTTRSYAAIRQQLKKAGTPIPENDIWIAALAKQHQLPVLSNDKHFDLVKSIQRIGWD